MKYNNGLTAGFTLIELLVVIAIIGLLSSIVLASLNSARSKAGDASVKAGMKQMQTQAQNYLDLGNANFGTSLAVCTSGLFADTQFTAIRTNVMTNAASGATMTCTTDSTGFKWAVSVSALKGGGNWCTDNNTGWFRSFTTNSGGSCS